MASSRETTLPSPHTHKTHPLRPPTCYVEQSGLMILMGLSSTAVLGGWAGSQQPTCIKKLIYQPLFSLPSNPVALVSQ